MATVVPSKNTSSTTTTTVVADQQQQQQDIEDKSQTTGSGPSVCGADGDDPDSFDLTGHNPTRDLLAEGIVSLLSPTIHKLDEGVNATKRSQEELSEQIALLTEQLKVISSEQVCPIDLDGYVQRLGTIKGKINVISSVLHAAQERLNRVQELAVKEANRRKPLLEPSPVLSISNPNPTTFISTSISTPQPPPSTTSSSSSCTDNKEKVSEEVKEIDEEVEKTEPAKI